MMFLYAVGPLIFGNDYTRINLCQEIIKVRDFHLATSGRVDDHFRTIGILHDVFNKKIHYYDSLLLVVICYECPAIRAFGTYQRRCDARADVTDV